GIYNIIRALDTINMGELSHLLHGKKGIPFFSFFIRVALTAIIALACTLICIIMIEKLFVKHMTFKQQLTQYSGILTPFTAVNVLIVLTGLAGSSGLATSLALLSLFTTTFIYGAIFIYDKVTLDRSTPQKLYAAVGVYLVNLLLVYILLRMFIMQKIDELQDVFYYL